MSFRPIHVLFVMAASIPTPTRAGLTPHGSCAQRISLDGTWLRWIDAGASIPIEAPFSIEPVGGLVAYEKTFTLPAGACEDVALLHFEGVVGRATVYLNEIALGAHDPYTPFRFDVGGAIHAGQNNKLTVIIDDRMNLATIPARTTWLNYSGITRSVYLECGDDAVLLSAHPRYEFSADYLDASGTVTVSAAGSPGTMVTFVGAILDHASGQTQIAALLAGGEPAPIGPDGTASQVLYFVVNEPELWSPDSPRLYQLYTVALVGGAAVDERMVNIGFRDIRVEGNRLVLNGKTLVLKGVSRHDMYPNTGFIGSEAQQVEDMTRIKSSGTNYVRLVHYPHHPRILELADELGLLISEEVPAWANFMDPLIRERLYSMMREMYERDAHHPSLILWILGNADFGPMPYVLEGREVFSALDQNRLISFVYDDSAYTKEEFDAEVGVIYAAGLDLYMKNTYWNDYASTLQDAWPMFPPHIPVVISELGWEGSDRGPVVVAGESEIWFNEALQAEQFRARLEGWRPHLPQYDATRFVSGLIVFNYQDIQWPEFADYFPGHVPMLHYGLVYEDRAKKLAMEQLSSFYQTLPDEFVGVPSATDVAPLFEGAVNVGFPVNGESRESGPALGADAQTLVYVTDAAATKGGYSLPRLVTSTWDGAIWILPAPIELPPDPAGLGLRTAPSLAPDGETVYFARSVVTDSLFFFEPWSLFTSAARIERCNRVNGQWSPPMDLGDAVNLADPEVETTDPYVDADSETLYFSSNRPGGFGGMDLWVTRFAGGAWSAPVNLGPAVNTQHDEREPAVAAGGSRLLFSSDRPGGFGNHDIWCSVHAREAWSTAKNLGSGVNSAGDDRGPAPSADGRRLLFHGLREGGAGLADLWTAEWSCAAGDLNRDGDLDLFDFNQLAECSAGSGSAPGSHVCAWADLDADGDVDVIDFARFQTCFGR